MELEQIKNNIMEQLLQNDRIRSYGNTFTHKYKNTDYEIDFFVEKRQNKQFLHIQIEPINKNTRENLQEISEQITEKINTNNISTTLKKRHDVYWKEIRVDM